MKKQLNTDAIANELRELSPFFKRANAEAPPVSPPAVVQLAEPAAAKVPEPDALAERPQPSQERPPRTPRSARTSRTPRSDLPPVKRHMKRHAFEIYFDQYDSLVRLAAEDRMAGGVGSMSQMVREALDRLIAERRGEQAA